LLHLLRNNGNEKGYYLCISLQMICIIRLVACASRPTDAAALASRLLISCSCLFGWAPPIVLGYSVVGWLRLHLFSIFPTIAVLRRARVRRNVTASYCTGRLSLRFNYVVVFHLHRKGLPFFFASQLQLSCAWHMSPSIIRTRRKMRGGGVVIRVRPPHSQFFVKSFARAIVLYCTLSPFFTLKRSILYGAKAGIESGSLHDIHTVLLYKQITRS
jgi:hypothetical protein